MRHEVSEQGGLLAKVDTWSTFLNQIKDKQFKDVKLGKIRGKMVQGKV